MNGIVCMKFMPASLQRLPFSQNDLSAFAMGLDLKGKFLKRLDVLCMGPPSAQAALLDCISYGADDVFLITDPRYSGSDTLITTRVLAKAIRTIVGDAGVDIVLCGESTADSGTGQVGPGLAYRLDFPFFPQLAELEIIQGALKARNTGYEVFPLQKILATVSGRPLLPFPSMKNILKAKESRVTILTNEVLQFEKTEVGLQASPTRVIRQTEKQLGPVKKEKIIKKSSESAAQFLLEIICYYGGHHG